MVVRHRAGRSACGAPEAAAGLPEPGMFCHSWVLQSRGPPRFPYVWIRNAKLCNQNREVFCLSRSIVKIVQGVITEFKNRSWDILTFQVLLLFLCGFRERHAKM